MVQSTQCPAHRLAGTDRKPLMNRRLHVAHVTFGLDVGGLERLLVEFARHADRERFDLAFISLGSRGALADEIEACGWPVTGLNRPTGLRPT